MTLAGTSVEYAFGGYRFGSVRAYAHKSREPVEAQGEVGRRGVARERGATGACFVLVGFGVVSKRRVGLYEYLAAPGL